MHVPPISDPKECDEEKKKKRGKNERHTHTHTHLLECLAHISTDKYPKCIVCFVFVICWRMSVGCWLLLIYLFIIRSFFKKEHWNSLVCGFDFMISAPNSIGICVSSVCAFPSILETRYAWRIKKKDRLFYVYINHVECLTEWRILFLSFENSKVRFSALPSSDWMKILWCGLVIQNKPKTENRSSIWFRE